MLAKVIAWAPTREQALRRLADALARARIHGVVTNRDLLVAVLRRPGVRGRRVTTDFLESREPASVRPATTTGRRSALLRATAAAVARPRRRRTGPAPASRSAGATSSSASRRSTRFAATARRHGSTVEWVGGRDGTVPRVPERRLDVARAAPARAPLAIDWRRRGRGRLVRGPRPVRPAGHARSTSTARAGHVRRRACPASPTRPTRWRAARCWRRCPAPSSRVAVEAGAEVVAGQTVVLVLEAMKMQHTVTAPHDGVVSRGRRRARRRRSRPGRCSPSSTQPRGEAA